MASEEPQAEVPPSSRLCVKNFPKYVEEARLKEYFSAKGEVTDVKVLRTKDGRSRQMGFIGFKSEADATAALRYYNRSYMDTMKLDVEYARKVGDNQLPRAWSKHTVGTTANKKVTGADAPGAPGADGAAHTDAAAAAAEGKAKAKKAHGEPLPEDADPKLREFMALMAPRTKARIWANDETGDGANAAAAASAALAQVSAAERQRQRVLEAARRRREKSEKGEASEGGEDGGSDGDDDYQDWTNAVTAAHRAGDGAASDEDMADADDGGRGGGGEEEEEEEEEGDGEVGDAVVVNEAVSDLDYLRSRMKRWDEDDDEEEGGKGEDVAAAADQAKAGSKGKAAGAGGTERGDQSGVGTSPRCDAAGPGGAKGRAGLPPPPFPPPPAGGPNADADAANGDAVMADAGGAPAAAAAKGWQHGGGGGGEGDEDEGIMDTGRLFVRNLAYTAAEADLRDLFGGMGDLQEVHLVVDRETKRSKGLAYIQFQIPEDAVRAAQQLDGTIYQGRLLHILPAKRAPGSAAAAAALAAANEPAELGEDAQPIEGGSRLGGPGSSTFKAARDAQRKADAGNRAAWNTLFMRPDTVAEAVAAHYGLSKASLLDPTAGGDSVAVRMALGEAQVIAATKQALADAGVSVEALERAAAAAGKASSSVSVARSPTTLLVKNLPFTADEEELGSLFGRTGPIARLVLPPAKAMALVEFTEPGDARAAFKSLAYKKYHHVPLYLEWAPADVFSGPPPPPKQQPTAAQAAHAKKAGGKGAKAAAADPTAATTTAAASNGDATATNAADAAAADAAAADAADADADADGAAAGAAVVGTIYVKNLAFATSDDSLRKHFTKAVAAAGGALHSSSVARKKGRDGAVLSLGYGFVEVDSEAMASAVIQKLQGSMLDGHKLALQLSRGRKAATPAAAAAAKTAAKKGQEDGSVKLVVRNLAFEATKKDIQGMFNPFGHLKSCRLPKKFDGSHRGFAFVEFVTKQEARNALEGVGGTHLYGRRLVVEYAREDDGLDEIRNKTAAKFARDEEVQAGGAPAKRKRL